VSTTNLDAMFIRRIQTDRRMAHSKFRVLCEI
jgi:hypothetical protein